MWKRIKQYIRATNCEHNYKKVLKRIQGYPKNRRIRVLFYVSENSKWGYQSLYELFNSSTKFEVIVCVGILNSVHNGYDKTRKNLEENYIFFKKQAMNVHYAYKNGQYINLKEFKPDIVFYEQKWDLPRLYRPYMVSEFALTCYCSYGFELFKNSWNYSWEFHKLLWKVFVENEKNIEYYNTLHQSPPKNCIVTGWPKLDYYHNNIQSTFEWKNPDKFKIIYAPHHSLSETSLQLATFRRNGKFILEWAKAHPETTWVFKAHPQFRFALLKDNIMTEEEIDEYYKAWEEIGLVYNTGDYFNIFQSSDLMITDCGSFLAEYLPTGKPLIRLTNKNSVELNPLGETIVSAYYKSEKEDNSDLNQVLKTIINDKNDYMYEQRQSIKEYIFGSDESAALRIYKLFLLNLCRKE